MLLQDILDMLSRMINMYQMPRISPKDSLDKGSPTAGPSGGHRSPSLAHQTRVSASSPRGPRSLLQATARSNGALSDPGRP